MLLEANYRRLNIAFLLVNPRGQLIEYSCFLGAGGEYVRVVSVLQPEGERDRSSSLSRATHGEVRLPLIMEPMSSKSCSSGSMAIINK